MLNKQTNKNWSALEEKKRLRFLGESKNSLLSSTTFISSIIYFLNKVGNKGISSERTSIYSKISFLPKNNIFAEQKNELNKVSTNHDDYGNYREKQQILEKKLKEKFNTPPKITNSIHLYIKMFYKKIM